MQICVERHTCSSETTIKEIVLRGCTLKFMIMDKISNNEHCEMVLIYGECEAQGKDDRETV